MNALATTRPHRRRTRLSRLKRRGTPEGLVLDGATATFTLLAGLAATAANHCLPGEGSRGFGGRETSPK